MTITDALKELGSEEMAGFELSMARLRLGEQLDNPHLPNAGYETLVVNYINNLNDFHFGEGIRRHFSTYEDVARMLKTEINCLTDKHTISLVDIRTRLESYCNDERAEWLEARNLKVLPRAVIHTMIDLIDIHKAIPNSRVRRKQINKF